MVNCGINKTGHRKKMIKNLPSAESFNKPAAKEPVQTMEQEIQTDKQPEEPPKVVLVQAPKAVTSTVTTQYQSCLLSTTYHSQDDLLFGLEQCLRTSIVLLSCNEFESFLQLKMHPADALVLQVLNSSADKLASIFSQKEANVEPQVLLILFEHAWKQIVAMKNSKQAHRYWTICKPLANDTMESLYEAQWRAQFVFGAELSDDSNYASLDGECLTFRCTNDKWYLCNFYQMFVLPEQNLPLEKNLLV